MKLSEGVEWAAHCLAVLGRTADGGPIPARRLAELHGVPGPYLAKHLQALARAGLVDSVPGPRGGFRLARPAPAISLLEVVEAVDGAEPAFRCTEIRQRGPVQGPAGSYRRPCGIAAAFADADRAWRGSLASTTIADLIDDWRQASDVAVWIRTEEWLADRGG